MILSNFRAMKIFIAPLSMAYLTSQWRDYPERHACYLELHFALTLPQRRRLIRLRDESYLSQKARRPTRSKCQMPHKMARPSASPFAGLCSPFD